MKFKSNIKILKNFLFNFSNPILSKVSSFKNKHHGQSCYIFGDGVSIKWLDLTSFSDKPVITLNKILFHKQSESLDIRYSIFLEPWYFYPFFWDRLDTKKWLKDDIHKLFRKIIKNHPEISFFTNLSNYPVLWHSNIFFLFQTIKDPKCKFFEECYASGENIYLGSIHTAISLAIYMGFEEIFLVGCDYTHEKSRNKHWFEKGEGILKPHLEYQKNFFNIAKRYVKITTITLEGQGNVLPAITYSNFTGKKPLYKENKDLTEISVLEAFSKSPWYKIF